MFPFLNTILWVVCLASVAVAVAFGLLAIWSEGAHEFIWKVEQTSCILLAGAIVGALVNWLIGSLFK